MQLVRGQRVTELMKQKQYAPLSVGLMASSLYAAEKGYLDKVPVDKIQAWEAGLHQFMASSHAALVAKLNEKGDWNDELEAGMKAALEAYVKQSAL
jgi:F-type H+-transporting ATPase subunit alpha